MEQIKKLVEQIQLDPKKQELNLLKIIDIVNIDLKLKYEDKQEPILVGNPTQLSVFPINHLDLWDAYQKMKSLHWPSNEIYLVDDVTDWINLDDPVKFVLSHILAFFAVGDNIVNSNLIENLIRRCNNLEATFFYGCQTQSENIHAEVYSMLIDTYISDEKEKNKLFKAVKNFNCIKQKIDWITQFTTNTSYSINLFAFAILEGLFFCGSFCVIFWIKESGKLNGLTQANELISRDESLHFQFAALLYSKLINKIDEKVAHLMMKEAVEIETNFITEAIPCRLTGMNSELMTEYIKSVADRLLNMFGFKSLYKANNPFPFMEQISLDNKANFFEVQPTNYEASGIGEEVEFNFNDDF
jgi:ribonucleoside-diphosphate reductase beta chain